MTVPSVNFCQSTLCFSCSGNKSGMCKKGHNSRKIEILEDFEWYVFGEIEESKWRGAGCFARGVSATCECCRTKGEKILLCLFYSLGPDCPVGKHLLVALNTQLTVQISSKSKLSELKLVISEGGGCDFWQVYALTKERDMLRREQNRKSDSSILLKEKDEIIKQVMAEGSVRSYGFSSC